MSTEGAGPGPIEHLLHEIRTPLSIISGNAHIVRKHWEKLETPKREDLLGSVISQVEGLNDTLRSLNHVESIRPRRGRLSGVSGPEDGPKDAVVINLDFGTETRTGRAPLFGEFVEQRAAVVRATLEALQGLLPFAVKLEDITIAEIGTRRLAVVSLDREFDTLVGSAIIRDDDVDEALARATLDALNRFLLNPALA